MSSEQIEFELTEPGFSSHIIETFLDRETCQIIIDEVAKRIITLSHGPDSGEYGQYTFGQRIVLRTLQGHLSLNINDKTANIQIGISHRESGKPLDETIKIATRINTMVHKISNEFDVSFEIPQEIEEDDFVDEEGERHAEKLLLKIGNSTPEEVQTFVDKLTPGKTILFQIGQELVGGPLKRIKYLFMGLDPYSKKISLKSLNGSFKGSNYDFETGKWSKNRELTTY